MPVGPGEVSNYGMKYLGGWGEASDFAVATASAQSLEDIYKTLRKYSKKEREYVRDEWRKLYTFYVNKLLVEEESMLPINDGYLKKLDKNLDLIG